MTIIKALMRPARLSFIISLVSVIALVSLLLAHETAPGDVRDPSDAVDEVSSRNNIVKTVW